MRTIARIQGIFRNEVGEEVFRHLVQIYPPGDSRPQHHVFDCELPEDDPRTRQVLDRLARAGFHPWTETDREMDKRSEFIFELDREYDERDLASARYLELHPLPGAWNPGASGPHETVDFPESSAPEGNFDFIRGSGNRFFVPQRVKDVLEDSGLTGVGFKRTYFIPLDARVGDTNETIQKRHGMPYWELTSDLTLPPLAPSMTFQDDDGMPVRRGDYSNGFHRVDGLYVHPELHYTAGDMAQMPPFDLARTRESFTYFREYRPFERPLVASQRFYRFCRDQGLKANWIPARIDPD